MTIEGKLIEKIELNNGLAVYFYDVSRKIAGDRWRVEIVIQVPVRLQRSYFESCPNDVQAFKRVTEAFGEEIIFQQNRVQNFVDEREVDDQLARMQEEFLDSSLSYLANDKFAAKFVRKRYEEWEKEQCLIEAQTLHLKQDS